MAAVAVKLSVVDVAPGILVNPEPVFTCHCTVGVGAPDAAAMNVAVFPATTVWFPGLDATEGAVPVPVPFRDMLCVKLFRFRMLSVKDRDPLIAPSPCGMKATGRSQLSPAPSTPGEVSDELTWGQGL